MHRYNHDDFLHDEVAEVLIFSIAKGVESASYEKMPKQNYLIQKLRDTGWDKKVVIGKYCKHSIDGILENTGVCVYFGHSQGAFQKFLSLQSLYEDNKIDQCYYITQSTDTAELRNRLVNPNARLGTTGNRITYDNIISGMGYYSRFITVPMTVIGIEISEKNFSYR